MTVAASLPVMWHEDVKAWLIPCVGELEPEAIVAMEKEFGRPCLMAGYVAASLLIVQGIADGFQVSNSQSQCGSRRTTLLL
jgi:hypothetical protein